MDAIDQERAAKAMQMFGGSFVATLAHLWTIADANNRARLVHAFADYFDKYLQIAIDLDAAKAMEGV